MRRNGCIFLAELSWVEAKDQYETLNSWTDREWVYACAEQLNTHVGNYFRVRDFGIDAVITCTVYPPKLAEMLEPDLFDDYHQFKGEK